MSFTPQTLQEKYYAINAALNAFLKAKGVRCPVIKYGIDPATLKNNSKDQTNNRYPYFQSFILNPKATAWTSDGGGVYTRFEYQLSFFTSPENEIENDAALFLPFNLARVALSDVNLQVLRRVSGGESVFIADLLDLQENPDFSMVSGAPVPTGVLLAKFAAVCGYPVHFDGPGISTDLDFALEFTNE